MSVWDERYRTIVEDDPEFKRLLDELSDDADKWRELNKLQMENHQLPVDDPIITIGRVLEYYNEMRQGMLRFRKTAEDLGEYAADLDDKLQALQGEYDKILDVIDHMPIDLEDFLG